MQIKIENARKMRLLSLFFSFQTHFSSSQTHPSLLKLTPLFSNSSLSPSTSLFSTHPLIHYLHNYSMRLVGD